ncbi:MAG: YraN family protein, partial [Clostridia bacterium]|nr:YraN family protein [Clostridia bacterium]
MNTPKAAPKTQKSAVGMAGEQIAVQFLEDHGYTVIERNFRSSRQEIDIIAKDEAFIIFVEVKTRSCTTPDSLTYGRPAHAVGRQKQHNVTLAAQAYLRSHPDLGLQPRLDVIEVYLRGSGMGTLPTALKINHIRNAFLAR